MLPISTLSLVKTSSVWVLLRRFWPKWKNDLILVQPETVVGWHRAGFKLYWKWLSRHRSPSGRRCVGKELRELIFRMAAENRTWGAPRIHGELKMLGFDISERTVLRWMRRAPRDLEPAKRWVAFPSNHREAIAAMDFFTVPTLTFGVLYGFFVIAHDRRRILHFGVTKHPSSSWVSQQLREAFPYDSAAKYSYSKLCPQNCRGDRESSAFCMPMSFWRGTTATFLSTVAAAQKQMRYL
jgi:putative transposase